MDILDQVYESLQGFAQSTGNLNGDVERIIRRGREIWKDEFPFEALKGTMEQGYEDFAEWLEQLLRAEPLPENIIALNFGFFESEDGKQIYLSGSHVYDPFDFDWACENTYFPEGRYHNLPVFAAITDFTQDYEAGIYLCLATAMAYVSEYSENHALPAHIATGFDDGDLVTIF